MEIMKVGAAYKSTVRIYCLAGNAKPSPKIGQALGPLGINMMQFCKEFNDRTQEYNGDVPMRVILKAYVDRSFSFIVKPPPTSYFIKKASGLEKLSGKPGHESAGRVSVKYIYEISKMKQKIDQDLATSRQTFPDTVFSFSTKLLHSVLLQTTDLPVRS